MFTDKDYNYRDWGYLFQSSKANTELSFLAEIFIARNSLRYERFADKL